MLDFDDFLGGLMDAGSAGRGWRSWWAILGLLIGAAVGGWLGYESSGILGALGGAATGGLIGWVVSILLTGLLRFAVFFLLILAAILAYQWLTGAL